MLFKTSPRLCNPPLGASTSSIPQTSPGETASPSQTPSPSPPLHHPRRHRNATTLMSITIHQVAIVIWLEPSVVVDLERLSRALRDLERSITFMERILSRPLDEFLNDDEAVYALRYAVIEAVEAAVQIGSSGRREPAQPALARCSKCSAKGESSRGISPRPCGGSQGLGTSLCTATGRSTTPGCTES